jgi:hypothetical protein
MVPLNVVHAYDEDQSTPFSNSGGAAARPRRPPPCGDLRRLSDEWMSMGNHLLMVNFCQPSHEFTFNVDIDLLF